MSKFQKFIKLSKVDEATHTAYGVATAEVVDHAGEICDYEDTVPQFKAWSEHAHKVTVAAGQDPSLGNIRIQHGMDVGGKVTKIDYDDANKQILIATEPANDEVWKLLKGGFFTGFSQGGRYLYRKCDECKCSITDGSNYCPDCEKTVTVRFAAKPSEVSYVDAPCVPTATFAYVKANGSTELRKFKPAAKEKEFEMKKTKAKTTLAEAVKAYVLAEVAKGVKGDGLEKDLYDVSNFASILNALSSLRFSSEYEAAYEEDGSTVPAQLTEDLKGLIETFIAMAQEETAELVAEKAQVSEVDFYRSQEALHNARAEKSTDEATKSFHLKCARAHGKMAEDCAAQANAEHQSDDAQKAAAAQQETTMTEKEEVKKEEVTPAAAVTDDLAKAALLKDESLEKSIGEMVKAQVKEALADVKDNPELKAFVQKAVQEKIKEALADAIKPEGAKLAGLQLVQRPGETVAKSETGNRDSLDTGF